MLGASLASENGDAVLLHYAMRRAKGGTTEPADRASKEALRPCCGGQRERGYVGGRGREGVDLFL